MKNYTTNDIEANDFILNYKIDSDENNNKNIIVNLASGKTEVYSYSKEKEKMILNKMKEQVLNHYETLENKKRNFVRISVIGSFVFIFIGFNLFTILSKRTDTPLANKIFEVIALPFGFSSLKQIILNKQMLEDIEKNYLFIENEELFAKEISLENIDLSNNKIKKFLKNKNEITINDMDDISLKNLERLILIIKYNLEFNKELEEEKTKKL